MAEGMRGAKRPVTAVLAGPYGHPFHPMLVTVPIGAWVVSLLFDLASRLVGHPGFLAAGSEWLIGIGVLGAAAAAATGFLDLAVIPPGTWVFRTACTHMTINLVLIFVYAGSFLWRHRTFTPGAPVSPAMVMLSAACVAALLASGYLGGKLTYRYGVRVAAESIQVEGYLPAGDDDQSRRAPRG